MSGRRAFQAVLTDGVRARVDGVTVHVHDTGLDEPPRLGLAVRTSPRSSVLRNRVKRRLRAAVALAEPAPGMRLVLRADQDAASVDFQELVDGFRPLVGRSS